MFQYITCENLSQQRENATIIDVREAGEFNESHFSESINIPASEGIEAYSNYVNNKLILVCQSESRAIKVAEKLAHSGFTDLFVLKGGVNEAKSKELDLISNSTKWSIDRQFRFILGALLFVGLIGVTFLSLYFLIIPLIIAFGLMFSGIIDKCYLRIAVARLWWNRS